MDKDNIKDEKEEIENDTSSDVEEEKNIDTENDSYEVTDLKSGVEDETKEEETLSETEVEEENDNDIVTGNIPVDDIDKAKDDDLPTEVSKKDYSDVEDNFGEEKSSKGILIAVILVVVVVAVLLVLKGCSKDEKYTVKFDTNGGNNITEQVVNKDDKVSTPSTPTKSGYKFIGWYVNGKEFNFDTKISSDMTIEAKWEKIEDVKVSGVTLDQTKVTLKVDSSLQLTAIVTPENAKDKSVTWTSSDENIVTVDENGNLTAKKKGNAVVTVKTNDGNYEAECKVTVSSDVVKVTGISLDKTTATVGVNNTVTLNATIKPKNASNKGIKWSSSDNSIATVENGKVKGLKEGKVTITAETKDGGYKATATITVKNIKVTGVTLNTTSKTIYVGDTYTLKATVKPTDATNKGVKWSSDDTSIVTVDGGKIKGIKEGKATITVTTKDGEYSAKATITVKKSEVTKIELTGSSSVAVGSTITLKAKVTATGNASKTVSWSVDKSDIASVNSKGVVTGKKVGTVLVTATAGGKSVSKEITVTATKLSLSITLKAVCAEGDSTAQKYSYTIYNGKKVFTDYSAIKIGNSTFPKGKDIMTKAGSKDVIIYTTNNGEVTVKNVNFTGKC